MTIAKENGYPVVVVYTKKDLGDKLRARRDRARLTQQQVADALGVDRVTYAYWEAGRSEMPATNLAKLSSVLDVPVGYFFGQDLQTYLTEDETELIRYYRLASPVEQKAGKAVVRTLSEETQVLGRDSAHERNFMVAEGAEKYKVG